jgi:hypothetical protein
VALNVAISFVRGDGRRRRHLQPLDEATVATAAAETREPDDRLRQLDAAMAALDPLHRALRLLVLDERSHREIAEVLGISESTVPTKLHRLKQRLRDQLAEPAAGTVARPSSSPATDGATAMVSRAPMAGLTTVPTADLTTVPTAVPTAASAAIPKDVPTAAPTAVSTATSEAIPKARPDRRPDRRFSGHSQGRSSRRPGCRPHSRPDRRPFCRSDDRSHVRFAAGSAALRAIRTVHTIRTDDHRLPLAAHPTRRRSWSSMISRAPGAGWASESATRTLLLAESARRARSALWPLAPGQLVQVLVWALVLLCVAPFWLAHRDTPHLLAAGLVMHVYAAAALGAAAWLLVRLSRLDHTAPVLTQQRQLAALRRTRIRQQLWLGLPGWGLWMVALELLAAAVGIDLVAQQPV